jgi:2-polyprenyl-3-methyl-5-hydroxy-6-metoxy-1,4-benzoquinol methylase
VTDVTRGTWDAEADRFDDEPDHGLRDHGVRRAWAALLTGVLPPASARVLDVGCGTGTIGVLLAELGYDVLGIDLAPRMVDQARDKARLHMVDARFQVGDAAAPAVDGRFDVVLARHVASALPDVSAALDNWIDLLNPRGRLILIEGFWSTRAGLRGADLLPMVQSRAAMATLRSLSSEAALWGAAVTDERYLISGQRP